MKKITAIFILFNILISSIGLTVYAHTCNLRNETTIYFYDNHQHCGSTDICQIRDTGCCEFNSYYAQDNPDGLYAPTIPDLTPVTFFINVINPDIKQKTSDNPGLSFDADRGPPLRNKGLLIFFQQFLL